MGILRKIVLAYKLLRDSRVPVLLKAIPMLGLAYLVFPMDLIADPILGLGQLDDLTVILLSIKTFVDLCPPELVEEHLTGRVVVDGEYREVPEAKQEISRELLTEGDIEYSVSDEEPVPGSDGPAIEDD